VRGAPLALAVAGRSIGRLIWNGGQTPTYALGAYSRKLRTAVERLIDKRVDLGTVQYQNLTEVVEASLSAANDSFLASDRFSIFDMHSALCVMQKQQRVPVTILARLWDLKNVDDAAEVVMCMSDCSIVDTACRQDDGVLCITLHDLVHDVCAARAARDGGANVWHNRLIDVYAAELQPAAATLQRENITGSACVPWWAVELADDGYVHGNIARHLIGSGKRGVKELTALLLHFRWTERQLAISGILSLRSDFELLRSSMAVKLDTVSCGARGDEIGEADLLTALDLISGAAQLAWGNAHKNYRELAFQMYGRLFERRSEMAAVDTYLSSVELHAERPWLRSIDSFLGQPGGALIVSPSVGFKVCCVVFLPGGGHVVAAGLWGNLVIVDTDAGGIVQSFHGHERSVNSVAVSADGSRIVSGGDDGSVRVWDVASGEEMGEPLRGHEGEVALVALTADESRIVSGGKDGSVRVWDVASGEEMGDPRQAHDAEMALVVLTADESRIVSGGSDGTVRVWDAVSGSEVGEPLRGHEGCVNSVAFSADGTRIVSGGSDGTVRVWDTLRGVEVGEPLRGHESCVNSVVFSADGTHIVSGGNDRAVRVWNTASGAQVGEPLRGHEGWVSSVAFRADGSRIVSGGADSTVRIWEATSGAAEVVPLKGHYGWVLSVAASADWSLVVSGGADGTVRVWCAASGAAVGEPLEGHDGDVYAVAVTADGTRVVSGGKDGRVRVWDADMGIPAAESLEFDDVAVSSVAVTADGSRVFAGDDDGRVRMWDAVSGMTMDEPLKAHEGAVHALAVNADGARLVSYNIDDGEAKVWDLASRECIRTIAEGLPRHARSADLLAAACLSSPRLGAQLTVDRDKILLTPQDGGRATCLGTFDAPVYRSWVFDESRLVMWGGVPGGPARVELVL
jgi:WD40 repeat protein